jgi:hypothetical protein
MKKRCYFIVAMLLGVFSTASFASIQNFWAYGSSDTASKSKYLSGHGKKPITKSISIDYKVNSNWTINSAHLWVKAVDDYKGGTCSGNRCKDVKRGGKDSKERISISNVEGRKANLTSKQIDGETWYDLLDVTSTLLNDTNNNFSAKLTAFGKNDFWFKNAKLVIDYKPKDSGAPISSEANPPPAAVPLPSAIWLFGSALLGLTGFKRKTFTK